MHPLEKFNYCPVCGKNHFEVRNVLIVVLNTT